MIENKLEIEDAMLMHQFEQQFKPFYRVHFRQFSPMDLFHEHFGYYRGDLIEFLYSQLDSIMLWNGFNRFANRCFLNPKLREQLAQGISREDFQKFFDFNSQSADLYRKSFQVQYIYLKGKEINLQAAADKVTLQKIHDAFWSYHQHFYGFPMNQRQFIQRLNQNSDFQRILARCRGELWDQHQRGH